MFPRGDFTEFRRTARRKAASAGLLGGRRQHGDCCVVNVGGELDIATAPQLVEALDQAAATNGGKVVVNLLETSFIDSTGLTTLFRAHKAAEERAAGEFSIVCGPDNVEVRRVMELMGFDEVFTLYESLAAAGCEPSS